MIYSSYKLNKQGEEIQPWCTPFPIWNQSIVPWEWNILQNWCATIPYQCFSLVENTYMLFQKHLGRFQGVVWNCFSHKVGRKRLRKEGVYNRLVCGFISKGAYIWCLPWAAARWVDFYNCLPDLWMEMVTCLALMISTYYCKSSILGIALTVGMVGRKYVPWRGDRVRQP